MIQNLPDLIILFTACCTNKNGHIVIELFNIPSIFSRSFPEHSKSPCVESEVSHSWYGAWFSSVGWATRYYYNLEKSECESKRVFSLTTSGKNRFYTKEECESVCRRKFHVFCD